VCTLGLCTEDDRNAPARDDSAWCAPTEVPVSATVLLDGGATRGALTTTLPPGIDPAGVGDGPECVRSEDVLCSPVATLLLKLRSITPSTTVDCNAPSVVTSVGRGHGALLRGVSQFATTGATTTTGVFTLRCVFRQVQRNFFHSMWLELDVTRVILH
jgi:hypothetical protein